MKMFWLRTAKIVVKTTTEALRLLKATIIKTVWYCGIINKQTNKREWRPQKQTHLVRDMGVH